MSLITVLLVRTAQCAAAELGKAAAVGAIGFAGYKWMTREKSKESRIMGMEQQKVLEMVASGKITPEEGVRLLNALTMTTVPKKKPLVDLPQISVPRIDLGNLSDVGVELKNTVVTGALSAKKKLHDSKAGKYLEVKQFDVSGPEVSGVTKAKLNLECSAGKLTLIAGETGGKLVSGKIVRVNQEPTVSSEVASGEAKYSLAHSLGKAALVASSVPEYDLRLQNSASESRLDLSDLKVNTLDIENNAGSIVARIGASQWLLHVNVQNNAGSVRLAVPTSHALRVVGTGSLSSSNLETYGLKPAAGGHQSSDWDTNEKRCEIVLVQNVASFELVWRKQKGDGTIEVVEQIAAAPPAATNGAGEHAESIPSGEL
jgi:hypothetical protein